MKRYAGPAAAVVMICLILASFIWLKEYLPLGGGPQPGQTPNIALRLRNAELVGRSHGRKTWRFRAGLIEVSRDRNTVSFSTVADGAFFDSSRTAFKLRADKLTYTRLSNGIEAVGNIIADIPSGPSISAGRLTWNFRTHTLVCPSRVEIDLGAGKGFAESLTANMQNQELVLKGVHIKFPVDQQLLKAE